MISFRRERTPLQAVMYGLYLYFLGLSSEKYTRPRLFVNRSHEVAWKWVQH